MADPVPYIVSYSFGGFQASNPTTALPGASVDNELANIATAVAGLIAAMKDVRRSDGALKNGIVTLDSLASALQLTVDPTNGTLVAAAVATAQAAQAAAGVSATASAGSATSSAASAAAAAASASSVNLTLFFPKAGNLAGVGNPDTARANLNAAKVDGSDMTGRLATFTSGVVTDWNTVVTSGWSSGTGAANQPPGGAQSWLVETVAQNGTTVVVQIAHNYAAVGPGVGTDAVIIYRRYSYDDGAGNRLWSPWTTYGQVPVGTTIWTNGTVAPAGFLKENGQLVSRATYPALFAFANASGNIFSDASWTGGNFGGFSTGDLATTFRLPDTRGEFIRGYDDGRGIDAARVLGAHQADSLKDHTHPYQAPDNLAFNYASVGAQGNVVSAKTTGSPSTGAAAETRPRNNAKLACIKF